MMTITIEMSKIQLKSYVCLIYLMSLVFCSRVVNITELAFFITPTPVARLQEPLEIRIDNITSDEQGNLELLQWDRGK